MRATAGGGFKFNKEEAKKDETKQTYSVIQDNYDGLVDSSDKKVSEAKQEPSVLDDDFMNQIKAVDVPDSDEECYF